MKKSFLILAVLAFSLTATLAAQTSQARLFCWSLRFHPSVLSELGQQYRLEVGTTSGGLGSNGELAPLFDPTTLTHITRFQLTSPLFPSPLIGGFGLDVPMDADENANGFPDFYESALATAARTTGLYSSLTESGGLNATWSRAAGTRYGTCRLQFISDVFGELVEIPIPYELIEWQGTFDYSPGESNVVGSLQARLVEGGAVQAAGAAVLRKSPGNRWNELVLEAGVWTNSLGKSLSFSSAAFQRDASTRTNYYAHLDFKDGDPLTSGPDYQFWTFSIDDPADADRDGIPDLSDDPIGIHESAPTLRIARSGDQLAFEIAGEAGRTYDLEEASAISGAPWAKAASVTLSGSLLRLEWPLPARSAAFWRLRKL